MTNATREPVLFLIATPIGNLGDISQRAITTLREADLVLAEDTRAYRKLASFFSIETKCLSYYEHNELGRTSQVVKLFLEEGVSVALISEAGTPAISDPGYRLINECHNLGIRVSTVPGPCAAIAALSMSGFGGSKFYFEGFLPKKKGKKKKALEACVDRDVATIIYESPHAIIATLEHLEELDPQREIFAARELTKIHEEGLRGKAGDLLSKLGEKTKIRGEFVVVVLPRNKNGI